MTDYLSFVVDARPSVSSPPPSPSSSSPVAYTITAVHVPILTRLVGAVVVDLPALRVAEDAALAEVHERLRRELDRYLAETGYRLVDPPPDPLTLHIEENPLRNQVTYRLTAHLSDRWEDGAWSTVRGAVESDQRNFRHF